MIFDGIKFRKTTNVVRLPQNMWWPPERADGGVTKNFVMFGRVVKRGTTPPTDAVKTEYVWERGDAPNAEPKPENIVWAVPIERKGHSLTNHMYGANGYSYLCVDGVVYLRKYGNKK